MNAGADGSIQIPKRKHYRLKQYINPSTGGSACELSGSLMSQVMRLLATKPVDARSRVIGLRRDFQLSRGQLAAFLGSSTAAVKSWETGRRNPSMMARRLIWLVDAYFRGLPAPEATDFLGWHHGCIKGMGD